MDKAILDTVVTDGVTVMDLICALQDVLDGTENHDIVSITGLSEADADKIIDVRNKTKQVWLASLR